MTANPDNDEPVGDLRMDLVFITRARCPACGSADLQTIRSEDQGDGSTLRRTFCRACFHKFRVIVE